MAQAYAQASTQHAQAAYALAAAHAHIKAGQPLQAVSVARALVQTLVATQKAQALMEA